MSNIDDKKNQEKPNQESKSHKYFKFFKVQNIFL